MAVGRTETDMLGERDLPADALFGIHTLRATENFDVSGIRLRDFPEFVQSLAMVKKAAARTNKELQLLAPDVADAIDRACDRLITCEDLTHHFPVDMMQGGAGTSTNMNVNEVIANLTLLGDRQGTGRLRRGAPQRPCQPVPVGKRRLADGHPGNGDARLRRRARSAAKAPR